MTGDTIVSSPIATVRADMPVGDCVRLMRDRKIGAVLVVSDDDRGELVGIFTERDLLLKLDLIQHGGHWNRPVRTVMTHPVVVVSVNEVEHAMELMVEGDFRHVPVVAPGRDGKPRPVGIISMRDLMKAQYARKTEPQPAPEGAPTSGVVVVSRQAGLHALLREMLAHDPSISVRRVLTRVFWEASFEMEKLGPARALVLDIDGHPAAEWTRVLRELNRRKQSPYVVVTYDPGRHSPAENEALAKLGAAFRFTAFTKPIEISAFIDLLGARLSD